MNRLSRRLSAVLALDVAGYSRLMDQDEDGTHRRMREVFDSIIDPLVASTSGRVIKKMGDGALIEFASAVDAITCALGMQASLEAREADLPPDRRIQLRIGINVGDVITEADDIFGDGVIVAARIEGIAAAGKIVVSDAAMQMTQSKEFSFTDLGLHQLKNIARPVRLFQVAPSSPSALEASQYPTGPVAVAGQPVIAVLPFQNQSPDAENSFFDDAITEDIVTALGKWRSFPVMSNGSTCVYKDRQLDIQTIGRELNVRYLVCGRLQKTSRQVRITTALIDVQTDNQILSEHYDFDIEDSFVIQDKIVMGIVGVLAPELLKREGGRPVHPPRLNVSTYECFHKGLWHHYKYTKNDSRIAQDYFHRALELEPDNVQCNAALAVTLCQATHAGWEADKTGKRDEALARARHAVRMDPRDANARFAMSTCYRHTGQRKLAEQELRETLKLNPSHAGAHANLGFVHNYYDRSKDAIAAGDIALRLSPYDPRRFIWLQVLQQGHYLAGDYRSALAAGYEGLSLKPDFLVPYRFVLASLGQLGRRREAEEVSPIVLRLDGSAGTTESEIRLIFNASASERIMEGLRHAGYA